jgi:hypothetical protein
MAPAGWFVQCRAGQTNPRPAVICVNRRESAVPAVRPFQSFGCGSAALGYPLALQCDERPRGNSDPQARAIGGDLRSISSQDERGPVGAGLRE